jgi:glycosyltransferase involved in cell wall biosynthesis
MNKYFITVIVPVYNAEKWLKKCVDSLLGQTIFNNTEIIIVDDGSTDNSPIIIDEYSKKYNNIRCFHIENSGVSNARNLGLNNCSTEYVTFVDADDYFDSDFLKNLFNAMGSECDITCSGFIAEYPEKSVNRCADREYIFNNKEAYHQFLMSGILEPNVTDKLFRTSIIGLERFNKDIAIAEDKLFLFHCLKKARKIKILPLANYHYLMNDSSACRKDFSPKILHTIFVADQICNEIGYIYPEYLQLSKSMAIDVKCRVYGKIYSTKSFDKYDNEFLKLKSEIKSFEIIEKFKYSTKKHFLAFIAARIHPALYCFLKNDLKLQYK